ncbi:uncharacterized protein LOC108668597 isoform X2 [Hyalella azteca]|uniref:Uncharacterized protein LOC108668597 isoform X2 n=1 Tax=Hyalella azteca TaxID=294128 RepID=A0A8B7NCK4_HYAAZ|nr:uncharacterized protein LOC108668597 isoform X2 [Hyalella azteca]
MTTREDSEVDQSNENPVDTQGKNARIAAREVCVEESASDGIALKCKHCALCNDASHNGNQPNGVSSSGLESKSKCGHCCSVEAIPALPCSTDSSHDLNHSLEIHKANGEKAMQNGSGYLVQDEELSDVHNGIGVDHSPSPVYLTSPCSENVKPIVADVSSASFFSCPDDRLASPGSDSMVTACDGTSSRSCSSLSCPSSGSSASSLICALSPDRDSVAPTCSSPSANSFVEDQLLESLANQMSLTGNGMENSLLNSTLVSQHETPEALCLDSQPNISMPASSDVSSYSLDDSMVQDMNDLSLAASTVQLQSECTQDCSAFDSLCDNVGVPSQWKELSASIRQLHQTVINSTVVEAGGSSCSVAVGAECSSGCRNSDSAAHPLPTVLCDSACHDCLTATSSECTPCSKSNGSLTREGQLEDSVSTSSTSGSTYTCKASSLAVEGELTSSSDANAANSLTTPDEGSSSNGQSSDALLNSSGSTLVGDNSSDGTLDQLMAIKDGAAQVDASSASSAPPSGDGKFKTPNIIDLANLRTHTVKISSPVFQRPSIDRIKSLVEDLMVTDPHQLVLRLSQLLQEMCELLKVRLLAEVLSSPTVAQSHNFAKSVCQAYQQVVCVVDAVRPALHALETRFSLNWFSFALHVFNITILEDKDVTGYINVCKVKVLSCSNAATEDGAGGEGDVSGLVWWSWLARVCQEAGAAAREGHATRVTPHNRHKFRLKDAAVGELPLPTDGVVAPQPVQHPDGGSQSFACECEHCSSSKRTAVVTQPYSSPTAALSDAANNGLYPHIHGPSASSPKRPLFDNPYVGSDMLSEQLMKEWEQAYGDTIAPPGPAPFPQACVDSMHCCTPAANVTHVSEGSTPAAPVTSSCSPAAVTTTTAPHEAPPVKHDNNYCCDRHHPTSASSSAPPAARARTKAMTCKHEDDCTGESQSGTADEWSSGCNSSSGDESDASSSGHVDNHCDCCYYHGVHHKQSGGRQKYSDRRDRLLRILNEKKIAGQSVAKQPEESQPARQPQQPYVGDKDIDTILSYIDGSTAQKNNKKKQKQRVKKVASKSKNVAQARAADDMSDSNDCTTTVSGGRRAANSKSASSSKSNYSSSSGAMVKLPAKVEVRNTTDADQKQRVGSASRAKAPLEATSSSDGWRDGMSEEEDKQERNRVVVQPAASLDELEDKDGAIAELRRRAHEVTVTLIKQDDQLMKHQVLQSRGCSTLTKSQEMQQQFQQLQQQQQPHQQRFNSGSSHPLHAAAAPPAFSAFAAPQPTLGGFGFPGLRHSRPSFLVA